MLFCPSLFAATLTTNTVPYVCQGGPSPQLCNSNITTDSNGNATTGFGTMQAKSSNTIYLAATDGFVMAYNNAAINSPMVMLTDANNPPQTVIIYDYGDNNHDTGTIPVKKGNYCEVENANSVYWMPLGS